MGRYEGKIKAKSPIEIFEATCFSAVIKIWDSELQLKWNKLYR